MNGLLTVRPSLTALVSGKPLTKVAAYCSLLTAYCSLLTAYCSLLTAYFPWLLTIKKAPRLGSAFPSNSYELSCVALSN